MVDLGVSQVAVPRAGRSLHRAQCRTQAHGAVLRYPALQACPGSAIQRYRGAAVAAHVSVPTDRSSRGRSHRPRGALTRKVALRPVRGARVGAGAGPDLVRRMRAAGPMRLQPCLTMPSPRWLGPRKRGPIPERLEATGFRALPMAVRVRAARVLGAAHGVVVREARVGRAKTVVRHHRLRLRGRGRRVRPVAMRLRCRAKHVDRASRARRASRPVFGRRASPGNRASQGSRASPVGRVPKRRPSRLKFEPSAAGSLCRRVSDSGRRCYTQKIRADLIRCPQWCGVAAHQKQWAG